MEEVNRILREAAEYIGEHGWCQHELKDEAIGAICHSQGYAVEWDGDPPHDREVRSAVHRLADHILSAFGSNIPMWNDNPDNYRGRLDSRDEEGGGAVNPKERTEIVDMQESPDDVRSTALANFVQAYVNPALSLRNRQALDSLIREYGKSQYGRGFVEGGRGA